MANGTIDFQEDAAPSQSIDFQPEEAAAPLVPPVRAIRPPAIAPTTMMMGGGATALGAFVPPGSEPLREFGRMVSKPIIDLAPTPGQIVESARNFAPIGVDYRKIVPPQTEEQVAKHMKESPAFAAAIGAGQALGDLDSFFTSPLGIATLATAGLGAIPAGIQRGVALGFSAQMASQTPAIARELGEELGKPEKDRDYNKISRLTVNALANTGFTVAGARHALAPRPGPAAPPLPPVEPAAVLGGAPIVQPGRRMVVPPPGMATLEQAEAFRQAGQPIRRPLEEVRVPPEAPQGQPTFAPSGLGRPEPPAFTPALEVPPTPPGQRPIGGIRMPPPPEEPPAPAPEPAPVPSKPPAGGPEIAFTPEKSGGKDMLGNPLGTKYYSTPEDWEEWKQIQRDKAIAREQGHPAAMALGFAKNEALKNGKYGGSVPLPPKGQTDPLVTVYHGEGGVGGAGTDTRFFTRDPKQAASFGDKITQVELPESELQAYEAARQAKGIGTPGAILPQEYVKRATPMANPPAAPVTEIEAPAAAPSKLVAAAYMPEGATVPETGPHHPGILKRLGITGFETPESRNTPQFGFVDANGVFHTREESAEIAKATGQDLKEFEEGEPAHSDEIESPNEPGVPISETKPPVPATKPAPAATPVAKVQREVTKTARTSGSKDAAAAKAEIIEQIEDALAKAPDAFSTPKPKKLTFDIPGDGVFTVFNTKEALGEMLKQAKRVATTSGGGKPRVVPVSAPSIDEEATKAAEAYGGVEAAYRSVKRQIDALSDDPKNHEQVQAAEALLSRLYDKTKAAELEQKADEAKNAAALHREGQESFTKAIAKLRSLKRPTARHRQEIISLEERLADNRARTKSLQAEYEQFTRQAEEAKTALEAEPAKGLIAGSDVEKWADGVIKKAGERLRAGLDPELAAAGVVKGVAFLERGLTEFAKWSAEMIKAFGEAIRPHLANLFEQAKEARAVAFRQSSAEPARKAETPSLPKGPQPPPSPPTSPVQPEAAAAPSGEPVHGIAARVTAAAAQQGIIAPVEPGEGIAAAESVEHGRDLLNKGADPQAVLDEFNRTRAVTADGMAVVRAHGERLRKAARDAANKFGITSDQYDAAWKADSDWTKAIKPMQTEWHKIGQAQQGEVEIDTGTFHGLRAAFFEATGNDFTPDQKAAAEKIAKGVKDAQDAADKSKDDAFKQIDKEAPKVEAKPVQAPTTRKRGPKQPPVAQPTTKQVWNRAKVIIDGGETDFDDVRHKLAIQFGLPVEEITRILAEPKSVRTVTDDMYRKMAERRRLVQQAKNWLKDQQVPGWYRFIRNVPRVFFIDKVFGHGTVGMITHAGLNIFNPPAWKTYWPNFLRQYKLLVDPGYHERMMQDLVRDPLFTRARRAGLANDPFRYQDDYQTPGMAAWLGRLGLAGNRGFDSLKLFRQARFNQIWNDLPPSLRNPVHAKLVADAVNHATGVVKTSFGGEWANWTFFAPKLEGSRWAWMIGDPVKAAATFLDWGDASPEAREFALSQLKEKAYIAGTYFGLLALNQGILSASGSKDQVNFTNPRRSDFLSFKAEGHNIGIVGPMLGMVRLFANMLHASTGKRGKVESLQSRADEMGATVADYARGKLSPFAGFGVDVATQADFQGRPLPFSSDRVPAYLRKQGIKRYTYGEYAAQEFTPIPVSEAVREVWRAQGMNESEINRYLDALLVGVVAGGTGARISVATPQKK